MLFTKSGFEMTQRDQFESPPIKPIYSQTEPNEPIVYGSAAIETIGNGGSDKLETRATFREKFSHDHRIEITVQEQVAASDEGNGIEQFFKKMAQLPTKIMERKARFRFA